VRVEVQDRVDGAEWAVGRFSKVLGVAFNGIAQQSRATLCGCRQQVAHPDQVVSGQCEAKHPADPRRSAMACLAQPGNPFKPAEDLLDAFTLLLTYQIAGMTSSPLINDSSGFASNVRGDLMVAQLSNKFLAVVALVCAQRDAMPAWDRCHHRHGRLWFRTAGGLGHAAVDREAVAVLHQHVAGVAELGLLARTLAGQAGLGIGGRLVGEVAAPLTVKVDAGIAGIVGWGVLARVYLCA
jgi:hypothetical protein